MREQGYYCFVYKLDPQDFGYCAARPRLWIVCAVLEEFGGLPAAELDGLMRHAMDECSRTAFLRPVVLQNGIMPEDHPIVDAHRQACSLQPHVTWQASAKRRKVAWHRVHAEYCLANAVGNWWESGIPDEDIQRLYPTLRALSLREFSEWSMACTAFPSLLAMCVW